MGLPADRLTREHRDKILMDVESWLIRRLVCQLTNKNYNKFFVSLLAKLKEVEKATLAIAEGSGLSGESDIGSAISAAVHAELTRSADDTVRWPKDEEFQKGWLQKAVYVKSRPDRAVMLLTAIDIAMRTSKSELSSPPPDLTVEHLLPQQGSVSDYPYAPEPEQPDGLSPDVRRAKAIHTIGNLTLLTQALNSSISNGPFKGKRPSIALNSDLRLNARFQDHSQLHWSEAEIAMRGSELFAFATNIWPISKG
jgi:hypothetical protein